MMTAVLTGLTHILATAHMTQAARPRSLLTQLSLRRVAQSLVKHLRDSLG